MQTSSTVARDGALDALLRSCSALDLAQLGLTVGLEEEVLVRVAGGRVLRSDTDLQRLHDSLPLSCISMVVPHEEQKGKAKVAGARVAMMTILWVGLVGG